MFGGSPTSVATPPTLESMASAISSGAAGMRSTRAMTRVAGAMTTTVVTLSRNIDSTVVTAPSMRNTRKGRPPERLPARSARYSKKPVGSRRATTIIMPSSSPMVVKSIAASASCSV